MSISLNFRKVERKRHLESWRRLCILDEGISKPPLQMPAGQACGLLSYRWNPSGVARPGWEGLPVWNRSRRCRWGGGTWVSTSWLPGYIRGSPRSKVATSIGALTSPPAPSDSFACIFCVAYTNFLCVCSLDNHKRLGMPHLYDIIIDNFLFYHMPNFSTTIFLSPNHFFISWPNPHERDSNAIQWKKGRVKIWKCDLLEMHIWKDIHPQSIRRQTKGACPMQWGSFPHPAMTCVPVQRYSITMQCIGKIPIILTHQFSEKMLRRVIAGTTLLGTSFWFRWVIIK